MLNCSPHSPPDPRVPALLPLSRLLGSAALVALLSLGLAGCASLTFRDANKLLAENRSDAAMVKFQEALSADPGNTEYRNAYLITRQKVLATLTGQAAQSLASGQRGEAERHYRRALEIDPASATAKSGLQALARDVRHDRDLIQAAQALQEGKLASARAKLMPVLDDNPGNERARELLRQLTAMTEVRQSETKLAVAGRKPLSIDFKEASLKQVFDVIAKNMGVNIIFDKDVKLDQRVSISLSNTTVEAALFYVLLTNQLEQQVMDPNTVLIFSAAKLKDYQPLMVKTFVLANASAKSVGELIKTMAKSKDVVIDEKLNMVIVRDTAEAIRLVEKLVSVQDVAEPEVMLEVEVLEVARDRLTELGVRWPTGLTLTPLSLELNEFLTLADLKSQRDSTIGVTLDPLKINARKVDDDTNLLANPRIRVINREKAKILIGNRVPSVSTTVIPTGPVTESVTYLDIGLKLEVEPVIYVDGDVAIKMNLEVSNIVGTSVTKQGTVTYNIGTRSATTVLRLRDGENQVLAGLINDEDRRTASKVPGLGDLPIAGRLFGSQLNDGKRTEIVLSITPRLIRNVQRPVGDAAEFYGGTESSSRRRPAFATDIPIEVAKPDVVATPTDAVSAPSAPK